MPEHAFRCIVCGTLKLDRVHPVSLFGYCRTCRWHRTFQVATDPEALRWARARNQQVTARSSDGTVAAAGVAGASSPPAAPADPFYPVGTDW